MYISKIKTISPANQNIRKIISLDYSLSDEDKHILEEFAITQDMIKKSLEIYRRVVLVANLLPADDHSRDWKPFIEKRFPRPKPFSKLDNIFLNKDCTALLIITNRRLMPVDVNYANIRLELVNADIVIFNEAEKEKEAKQKASFKDKIKNMFS